MSYNLPSANMCYMLYTFLHTYIMLIKNDHYTFVYAKILFFIKKFLGVVIVKPWYQNIQKWLQQ